MTWDYRIIRFADHLSLHEVYYDGEGNPIAYYFVCNFAGGRDGSIGSLEMALEGAQDKPILDVAVFSRALTDD